MVEECVVKCVTVQGLLQSCNVDHVNILQIDAEGYDFEIVKSIDLDVLKPEIICFEFLTLGEQDRSAAVRLLVEHGYRWARQGRDIFAVHSSCSLNVAG